ncbi:hypothetical protein J0A68_22680, partial [Algoriphagus sp. H41]
VLRTLLANRYFLFLFVFHSFRFLILPRVIKFTRKKFAKYATPKKKIIGSYGCGLVVLVLYFKDRSV